jgi:queuine tRNA-ribosyltransferase
MMIENPSSLPTHLDLPHGRLELPAYLPDATYGVVRAVDSEDLLSCRVKALVMNTFHLMQRPGSAIITSLGGLHHMTNWHRPIVTDSGGFQAYSLIRQNPKFGSLSDRGLSFQPEGSNRKYQLSPEKSIQLQMSYGADIVICLDDCTHVDDSYAEQRLSVERTIAWAKRSKREYDRLIQQKKLNGTDSPRIFGVIQGGREKELRRACAEALLEIGFDGFGFGGWPLDAESNLLTDILGYTRELIPPKYLMHALGVGHPHNVLACFDLGYTIFDSAMPTRDARHGRLYTFTQPADAPNAGLTGEWLRYLYIGDEKHLRDSRPIMDGCDCPACRQYSIGYLHHIFKMNDSLYPRLATLHNLFFMSDLTDRLRARAHV